MLSKLTQHRFSRTRKVNSVSDILKRYMTVSLDLMPDGMNVSCWMSTVEFWSQEVATYPHIYTYMGDRCTWFIHSNTELTPKLIQAAGETADRICAKQSQTNKDRKVANR